MDRPVPGALLHGPVRRGDGPPHLTVAIVSYRRPGDIVDTLRDLAAQATARRFEVLLVLQDYPAGVPEQLVATFGGVMELRVVLFDHGLGVHGARNEAVDHARGEIVAFLDDDVRLAPDWVDQLAGCFDDATVGGVGGFVAHPGCERASVRWLRPLLGMASRRYRIDWGGFHTMPYSSHAARDLAADWLSGCNMAFRRAALQAAGPFVDLYGAYGFDDVDMSVRVRRAGWRLVSTPRLAVRHFPSAVNRPDLASLMRQEEARRVLFVRRAIGDRPLWRARYIARVALSCVGATVHGLGRGEPLLAASVLRGAVAGLRRYGR